MELRDIGRVKRMFKGKDYVSIIIIIVSIAMACFFGIRWLLLISFVVLYRAYVENKQEEKIHKLEEIGKVLKENGYSELVEIIKRYRRIVIGQLEVKLEDLKIWLPLYKNEIIVEYYDRLKKDGILVEIKKDELEKVGIFIDTNGKFFLTPSPSKYKINMK